MLRLLAFLWSGCWHKWVANGGRTDVYETLDARDPCPDMPAYTKYRYRCSRCGLIREFRA